MCLLIELHYCVFIVTAGAPHDHYHPPMVDNQAPMAGYQVPPGNQAPHGYQVPLGNQAPHGYQAPHPGKYLV